MRKLSTIIFVGIVSVILVLEVARLSEPMVTNQHTESLSPLETELERINTKPALIPEFNISESELPEFIKVNIKKPSVPTSVTFQPTSESRYFVLKGKIPLSFGKVHLGPRGSVHFRNSISEDGNFELGPIQRGKYDRLFLYFVLKHKNVSVYYNEGENIKPVKIRLGPVDLQKNKVERRHYELAPKNNFKRQALNYFKGFVNWLRENPGRERKNYRIEYMEGIDKPKIRREGTHYILPLRR